MHYLLIGVHDSSFFPLVGASIVLSGSAAQLVLLQGKEWQSWVPLKPLQKGDVVLVFGNRAIQEEIKAPGGSSSEGTAAAGGATVVRVTSSSEWNVLQDFYKTYTKLWKCWAQSCNEVFGALQGEEMKSRALHLAVAKRARSWLKEQSVVPREGETGAPDSHDSHDSQTLKDEKDTKDTKDTKDPEKDAKDGKDPQSATEVQYAEAHLTIWSQIFDKTIEFGDALLEGHQLLAVELDKIDRVIQTQARVITLAEPEFSSVALAPKQPDWIEPHYQDLVHFQLKQVFPKSQATIIFKAAVQAEGVCFNVSLKAATGATGDGSAAELSNPLVKTLLSNPNFEVTKSWAQLLA